MGLFLGHPGSILSCLNIKREKMRIPPLKKKDGHVLCILLVYASKWGNNYFLKYFLFKNIL
jgi:hypothetical protein